MSDPADESPARSPDWHGLELLRRIGNGDEDALSELHRVLADRLFSMALRWLGDRSAAAEVLNDTFLRVWRRAASYDPARSQPFTWCVMLMRGLCLDRLRKRSREAADFASLLDPPSSHGLEDLMFHDTIEAVSFALNALDPEDRHVLSAALFDPASTAELAERWGIEPGGARTRIHRAMLKLRTHLRNRISP